MFNYTKKDLEGSAADLNFVANTLEKVLRLADILKFLNANTLTQTTLALKGGTAINLTVFDLPRLSVDIDLDYAVNDQREEMMNRRALITEDIKKYLSTEKYTLTARSKSRHSLDSFVFAYRTLSGATDNIKIEINYSLRAHIFDPENRLIIAKAIVPSFLVYSLATCEIFAGKINALLSRTAPRDLYDVYNMIKTGLFQEKSERNLLRKSIVFYRAISQKETSQELSLDHLKKITPHQIRTDLLPVIQNGEIVILETMQSTVRSFISELMTFTDEEHEFLKLFNAKDYRPELLFNDDIILAKIRQHPMAIWKMQEHRPSS